MSMKAVELQFAVHKNADAGHVQQQLLNRPVLDQAQLAAQANRTAEHERQAPVKPDETPNAMLRGRQSESGAGRNPGGGKRKAAPVETPAGKQPKREASDPYKGRHIDLSL